MVSQSLIVSGVANARSALLYFFFYQHGFPRKVPTLFLPLCSSRYYFLAFSSNQVSLICSGLFFLLLIYSLLSHLIESSRLPSCLLLLYSLSLFSSFVISSYLSFLYFPRLHLIHDILCYFHFTFVSRHDI